MSFDYRDIRALPIFTGSPEAETAQGHAGSSTRVESFRLPDLLAAAAAGYGQAA